VEETNDEKVYATALHVPVGTTVDGPIFSWDTFTADCLTVFVQYAPGSPGNSLELIANFGCSLGFFPLFANGQIALTASAVVALSTPGGPKRVRLSFHSNAAAGPDDVVDVVVSGVFPGATLT